MLKRLRQLFSYDVWANREVLASFRREADAPLRSLRWMAHILATDYLWLSRIRSEKSPLPVWPELTLADCDRHAAELAKIWSEYLSGLSEGALTQQIPYINSKGEPWVNTVDDILMHVVMHSAYHRGQIASNMRDAGLVPAYTDFIHGIRQKLVE
jgi:uncharacterized damage-inducible protein DinB